MNWRFLADSEGRADTRRFFLIALLGCFVLGALLLATDLWSDRSNADAAGSEINQVRTAVTGEVATVAGHLRAYAAVTPINPPAGSFVAIDGPFDHLFLVDTSRSAEPAGPPALYQAALKALLDGRSDVAGTGLRGAIDAEADSIAERPTRADVIAVDGRGFVAVRMGVGATLAGGRHSPRSFPSRTSRSRLRRRDPRSARWPEGRLRQPASPCCRNSRSPPARRGSAGQPRSPGSCRACRGD